MPIWLNMLFVPKAEQGNLSLIVLHFLNANSLVYDTMQDNQVSPYTSMRSTNPLQAHLSENQTHDRDMFIQT